MASEKFKSACTRLKEFSDVINFAVTKGSVKFTGRGKQGSSAVTCNATDWNAGKSKKSKVAIPTATTIKARRSMDANFSMKYLNCFVKATPLCDKVRLSISNEMPMMLEYEIERAGYLRFYLAPI